jgi:hypothetical protein
VKTFDRVIIDIGSGRGGEKLFISYFDGPSIADRVTGELILNRIITRKSVKRRKAPRAGA